MKRFVAAVLPPRWAFVRRWRGGHWELVDFDVLYSVFRGRLWMQQEACSRGVLPFEPRALVRCEDHPP